jgi:hypothetical protein
MNKFLACVVACFACASFAAVPNVSESFDSSRYANGYGFPSASETNGWQASGTGASVTNQSVFSGQSVLLYETVTLTNTLANPDADLKVWTDFRVWPMLGVQPSSPPTNEASFVCYFGTGGYVSVWNTLSNDWLTCTNDVWGNAVTPVTNSVSPASSNYARLSVFQDYANKMQAIFLNDQLIRQDLGFVYATNRYSRLIIQNSDSNCWLDSVSIVTNTPDLTGNRNGDGLYDAVELATYGYAARTHYVNTNGVGYPNYTTIAAAVSAARSRDKINVGSGDYSAVAVTVSNNISFEGNDLNIASLNIASGVTGSFAQAVSCGNMTVASGSSVTFSNSVNSGDLLLTGTVAMASGQNFTSTTATVVGNLGFTGDGDFVVNTSLSVSGQVNFDTGRLLYTAGGIDMSGTFTISNTWGSAATMGLPFADNFDLYATNTVVTNLGFRGWGASDGTVKIQNAYARSGNAVVLPDGTVLSNRISSTATKVWTDYYIRPAWGVEPAAPPTSSSSFLSYVNASGYLTVATNGGGWVVCSNLQDAARSPASVLASNDFTRVTVCQDLSGAGKFAVFVSSNLVAQGLSAPATITTYSSFVANNTDGSAYLDDVLIATDVPSGLSSDLDGDGLADAYEVNSFGLITAQPNGGVFKLR